MVKRLFIILGLIVTGTVYAQTTPPTRVLFILDASNSMYQKWNDVIKIEAAKKIMSEVIDEIKGVKNLQIALRVYGTESPITMENCKDTRLLLPFDVPDFENFKRVIYSVKPNGITPIAYSLQQCVGDFPSTPGRNVVVLVTDGIESCHGDPCAISLSLQKQGIFFKPFVIGLNIKDEDTRGMECVGAYFNAPDAAAFRSVLKNIVHTAISNTYLQVNLDDINNKPTETDAVMSFTDVNTNLTRYNYYHTFNYRGESDTVSIDPVNTYNLTVFTTPVTEKKSLDLKQGANNIINLDVPQGYMEVQFEGQLNNQAILKKIATLVRIKPDDAPVCIMPFNTRQKMVCGNYNIEILTIPRTYISNVNIGQSKTTTIKLPMPGVASMQKNTTGYGSIFIMDNTGYKKVYDLLDDATIENVALQPGTYMVIYKSKNNLHSGNSEVKEFKITSGQYTSISL